MEKHPMETFFFLYLTDRKGVEKGVVLSAVL